VFLDIARGRSGEHVAGSGAEEIATL
jgi:hypothetical protein